MGFSFSFFLRGKVPIQVGAAEPFSLAVAFGRKYGQLLLSVLVELGFLGFSFLHYRLTQLLEFSFTELRRSGQLRAWSLWS